MRKCTERAPEQHMVSDHYHQNLLTIISVILSISICPKQIGMLIT